LVRRIGVRAGLRGTTRQPTLCLRSPLLLPGLRRALRFVRRYLPHGIAAATLPSDAVCWLFRVVRFYPLGFAGRGCDCAADVLSRGSGVDVSLESADKRATDGRFWFHLPSLALFGWFRLLHFQAFYWRQRMTKDACCAAARLAVHRLPPACFTPHYYCLRYCTYRQRNCLLLRRGFVDAAARTRRLDLVPRFLPTCLGGTAFRAVYAGMPASAATKHYAGGRSLPPRAYCTRG